MNNSNKKRKTRIVFYIDGMNRGGTEKATLDLVNNLDLNKYEISLIKFFPGGSYNKDVKREVKNITSYPIPIFSIKNKRVRGFFNKVGRKIFDLIPIKWSHKYLICNKYDI